MTTQLTPVKVEKLVPNKPHGLVVVITGNGKGKTTSAMGMVLRASGYGMKVCIIQFMKGDLYSGEWDGVKLLGERVEMYTTGILTRTRSTAPAPRLRLTWPGAKSKVAISISWCSTKSTMP